MAIPYVEKVKRVRQGLTDFFDKVSRIYSTDEVIFDLMLVRGYQSRRMYETLKEVGVFRVDDLTELTLAVPEVTQDQLSEWGLLTSKGDYLLRGRYVLPIRDIQGQVIALVGWDPQGGTRKYVTTPTLGFSRDVSFFNLDCYRLAWEKWNGVVYLVEGIFDTLALRSLGFAAIGNQGLEMSLLKTYMLTRFSKVIAIPDNDNSGRSVNPYLNRFSGKSSKFVWRIENDHVFVQLPDGVKDVDELLKSFDAYDDLVSCQSARFIKKLKDEDSDQYCPVIGQYTPEISV